MQPVWYILHTCTCILYIVTCTNGCECFYYYIVHVTVDLILFFIFRIVLARGKEDEEFLELSILEQNYIRCLWNIQQSLDELLEKEWFMIRRANMDVRKLFPEAYAPKNRWYERIFNRNEGAEPQEQQQPHQRQRQQQQQQQQQHGQQQVCLSVIHVYMETETVGTSENSHIIWLTRFLTGFFVREGKELIM